MAAKAMIAEMLPELKVEVIDTLNVSMCHGWIAIEAARDAMQDKNLAEITSRIKQMIPSRG